MPGRSALPFAALLAGVVLLASACSRPHRPTWATGAPVRVVMNDRFRYRPAAIIVRAGRRVTFVVSNVGRLPHEFILGDRTTQLAHERRMQAPAGGHVHAHGPTPAPSPSRRERPAASAGHSTSPAWSSTAATSSATGPPA